MKVDERIMDPDNGLVTRGKRQKRGSGQSHLKHFHFLQQK